jgi:hypothetical protein
MLKLATTLLGLTLTLGSAQAQNQNQKLTFSSTMECNVTGVLEKYINEEFGERSFSESKIFLQATKNSRLYEGKLVVYINPETKTYSLMVEFEDDKISCMLGSGVDFAPAKRGPNI